MPSDIDRKLQGSFARQPNVGINSLDKIQAFSEFSSCSNKNALGAAPSVCITGHDRPYGNTAWRTE